MIPVYEAVFKEGETQGIYALSVVENPAMEDLWVALSEQPQQIEFAKVDEDKRLLLGAALIPNKKIYRNIDGNEFYITFSEQTIEKLAHEFFKNQANNNSSLEHEVKLEGMSVVEGWIVEDPDNDKSNAYGKKYEKGTWVTMMKVDNDEMWEKVKSEEIKGFSIDAVLGLTKLNLKSEIEMTKEVKDSIVNDVLNGVKTFFSNKEEKETVELTEEVKAEEVKAEEVVLAEEEVLEEEEVVEAEETVYATKEEFAELKAMVDEMKSMLEPKAEVEEEEEILMAKNAEIETLKTELAKTPEAETVSVTPEVATKKAEVKMNSYNKNSIKSNVFQSLANSVW